MLIPSRLEKLRKKAEKKREKTLTFILKRIIIHGFLKCTGEKNRRNKKQFT
jgi:hypothetical protein